jgi:hypothetical protein
MASGTATAGVGLLPKLIAKLELEGTIGATYADDTRTRITVSSEVPIQQCFGTRKDVFEITYKWDGSAKLWDDEYIFEVVYYDLFAAFEVSVRCGDIQMADGNLTSWAGYRAETTIDACCNTSSSASEPCCGCEYVP